jgi:hypothetical protein
VTPCSSEIALLEVTPCCIVYLAFEYFTVIFYVWFLSDFWGVFNGLHDDELIIKGLLHLI